MYDEPWLLNLASLIILAPEGTELIQSSFVNAKALMVEAPHNSIPVGNDIV